MPVVSLVFVTYNRATTLHSSLRDILSQSFSDFELIICDDQSTDGTEAICRDFEKKDSRITYLRQHQNLGMPGNINAGFRLAKGEFIGILHDGDSFHPELIANWYRGISSSPKIGLVFNTPTQINEDGSELEFLYKFKGKEGQIAGHILLEQYFFRAWAFGSVIYGMAMFRRSLGEQLGFFNPAFSFYADVDFWMQILQDNDAWYCEHKSLIVCPNKCILPRTFDDRTLKTHLLLQEMFKKHRLLAFRNRPLRFAVEMSRFYCYAIVSFIVCLRATAYNKSLNGFKFNIFQPISSQKPMFLVFLPVWFAFFGFYRVRSFFAKKTTPTFLLSS